VPRQIRIEYPGAIYHVMSRGDHRENIVRDDSDRRMWQGTLGEACGKCEWQVHAHGLMSNHFHLVVETPLGNLVGGMKWFLGTYTVRFNTRHHLHGHLFAGRYKSLLVDESDDSYLRVVCDYVHLNPVRAGLLRSDQALSEFAWSSYPYYLRPKSERPNWLRTDRLLGEHGLRRDDRRSRLEFSRRMEAAREGSNHPVTDDALIQKRWWFGGEAFLARLLDRLDGTLTENHVARERVETAEMKAERIIRMRLGELGWTETDLRECAKCAREKIHIAQQLRAETTLSLKWVAQRLSMGTWTNVSNLLYEGRRRRYDLKD
jgi:putative transposase